nr:hypothetical protein [Tanacetum cinerariifolium]
WGNDCRSGVRGGGSGEEWRKWSNKVGGCAWFVLGMWGNDCRSGVRGGGSGEEWRK